MRVFYNFIKKLQLFSRFVTFGLHRKTFLLFSTSSLILMMLLSYMIYAGVDKYIRNETNNYLDVLTQTINNNIDKYVEEMKKILLGISVDSSLKFVINNQFFNEYDKYSMEKDFLNRMNALVGMRKYNDIHVYSEVTDRLISTSDAVKISGNSYPDIKKQPWYQKVISSPERIVLLSDYTISTSIRTLTGFGLALKVQNKLEGGNGILFISSTQDYFNDMFANIVNDSLKFLIITDGEGNVIYNSDKNKGKGFNFGKEQLKEISSPGKQDNFISEYGSQYLAKVNVSPYTGWNTISFVSAARLQQPSGKASLLIIFMTGIVIVLMFVISYFISSRITASVKKLIKVMKRVENGDFNVMVHIESNDEIGQLGNSFNVMIGEINKLIHQVIKSEILEKEAELNALQQQINPHFLYNILESVNSLASVYGNNEICEITEKLGKMFRYSISQNRREHVLIKDEIQHLKNYIDIQQIRYGNDFSVVFDVEPEILTLKTIKFILQPIAENAIIHGLKDMENGSVVKITGRRFDNTVLIEIEDNGTGIDRQRLIELNEYLRQPSASIAGDEDRKSIGLKNVHSRITLAYGEKFGLEIRCGSGMGTNVIVSIPANES
ncbi:MAG: sensor histidine kinase [Ruminiclostridium sp.]|nr:sensor histidine kinase [Ruminiclostridium sp.]